MGADINYSNPKTENLTFIQIACRDKNDDMVAELLKAPHININAYEKDTFPALHYAVVRKSKKIINLLLAHDPQTINICDSEGNSCLHLLCEQENNNSKKIMLFLLSKDFINPNIYNNAKRTPLHIATIKGFTNYIQILIDHKTDTLMRDYHGQTPCHSACYSGKIKNVKLLTDIKKINSQDYAQDTLLHHACLGGHTKIIKFLLKQGACPTIKNRYQLTPLANAYLDSQTFNYSPSLKKLLLKKDKYGNTQLHLATLIINFTLFDSYLSFLVTNGLSVWERNKKKQLPVDCACKEYARLYKEYMTTKRSYLLNGLEEQERTMHAFLRLTSSKAECALFTEVINNILPNDLLPLIACYYYGLNIETIVANKYKHNDNDYYINYIENKNEIRKQLLEKPEPKLLWSAL